MEDSDFKTRADFNTDSEWYTYQITHEEKKMRMDDENDDILISDKELKEKFNMLQRYQCIVCKNEFFEVLKEYIKEDFSMAPLDKMPIFKHLERCPFCDARRKNFLTIKSKLQLKEEKEKKKEDLKLEKNRKIIFNKIKKELTMLKQKLDYRLELGEITPERYYYLFVNLAFNIVKWNLNKDIIDRKEQLYKFSRNYAMECSKVVLDKAKVKEGLDEILERYSKKQDELLLELEKQVIERSFENKLGSENQEANIEIKRIQADLDSIKSEIEFQQKRNEERMNIEEKYQKSEDKKLEKEFEKELRKLSDKK